MRAYRTIRFVEFPDVADIKADARKSSVGRLAGDESTYSRNTASKRRVRRAMKRRDRQNTDAFFKGDE